MAFLIADFGPSIGAIGRALAIVRSNFVALV